MATERSQLNGQPYPGYVLSFSAGTSENPAEYPFVLAIQPNPLVPGTGPGDLTDAELSVLEGVLNDVVTYMATLPNVYGFTGTPKLIRLDEVATELYVHV